MSQTPPDKPGVYCTCSWFSPGLSPSQRVLHGDCPVHAPPTEGQQPAFPVTPDDSMFSGMTLRDWFAGQALAGQIANPNWPPNPLPAGEENAAAHWAYEFADAMLAEREEHPPHRDTEGGEDE